MQRQFREALQHPVRSNQLFRVKRCSLPNWQFDGAGSEGSKHWGPVMQRHEYAARTSTLSCFVCQPTCYLRTKCLSRAFLSLSGHVWCYAIPSLARLGLGLQTSGRHRVKKESHAYFQRIQPSFRHTSGRFHFRYFRCCPCKSALKRCVWPGRRFRSCSSWQSNRLGRSECIRAMMINLKITPGRSDVSSIMNVSAPASPHEAQPARTHCVI